MLYTVGFGMLGFINSIPFVYISIIIITLGEIVMTISSAPFIVNHTPASHRGRMDAVLPIIMGLGFTIGQQLWVQSLSLQQLKMGGDLLAQIC